MPYRYQCPQCDRIGDAADFRNDDESLACEGTPSPTLHPERYHRSAEPVEIFVCETCEERTPAIGFDDCSHCILLGKTPHDMTDFTVSEIVEVRRQCTGLELALIDSKLKGASQ